jgi:hypothetical protein
LRREWRRRDDARGRRGCSDHGPNNGGHDGSDDGSNNECVGATDNRADNNRDDGTDNNAELGSKPDSNTVPVSRRDGHGQPWIRNARQCWYLRRPRKPERDGRWAFHHHRQCRSLARNIRYRVPARNDNRDVERQ